MKCKDTSILLLTNTTHYCKVQRFTYFKVRRHVYHDADNLDTAFDAGGKVSIGLTATTIVSQWTWSATLLQSSTVASKVRITMEISTMTRLKTRELAPAIFEAAAAGEGPTLCQAGRPPVWRGRRP